MTNSQPTSDEREERLKDIRHARELGILPWSHLSNPTQRFEVARDTLDFLLSLIDSQVVDSDDERLEAMLKKSGIRHTCHRPHDAGTALERLARNISDLAATAMRDKGIEKVKDLLHNEVNGHKRGAFIQVLAAIESLTLDQVEREKQ